MVTPAAKPVRPVLALALSLLCLAAGGCPVFPEDTPVREFKCRTEESGTTYYLYVPSTYAPDRRWPMVVTLHGTHGFDSAAAQAKEWRGLAEKHGFLVLAPALSSTQGILPVLLSARLKALRRDEANVLEAIAEVKGGYQIDGAAVMITGFSSGGYPLYYIALRNPELFRVLVARMCNADVKILETIPITERVQAMPMLVFYSQSGLSPLHSSLSLITQESWAAFRYLRLHKCTRAEIDDVPGGHQRRAQRAFQFWRRHQPQLRPQPE